MSEQMYVDETMNRDGCHVTRNKNRLRYVRLDHVLAKNEERTRRQKVNRVMGLVLRMVGSSTRINLTGKS